MRARCLIPFLFKHKSDHCSVKAPLSELSVMWGTIHTANWNNVLGLENGHSTIKISTSEKLRVPGQGVAFPPLTPWTTIWMYSLHRPDAKSRVLCASGGLPLTCIDSSVTWTACPSLWALRALGSLSLDNQAFGLCSTVYSLQSAISGQLIISCFFFLLILIDLISSSPPPTPPISSPL